MKALVATEVERPRPGECCAALAFRACRYAGRTWPTCAAPQAAYRGCPYSAANNSRRPRFRYLPAVSLPGGRQRVRNRRPEEGTANDRNRP